MTIETILGSSVAVFIGLTVVVMGGCAVLTGQARAEGWGSWTSVMGYALLIGVGDRFLVFALFDGPLFSVTGFIIHTLVVMLIADFSWRVTRARRMVSQYPWLYERAGPFGWSERADANMTG